MCRAFCLHLYLCTLYVRGARGGQKKVDPLGLELQMIVNHLVDVGNWDKVLWESIQCS